MADRVQAYNHKSVPWMNSRPENTADTHSTDLDRHNRQPHRAATEPSPTTTSSRMNPYTGQAAYPPASLYPGQRNPQTTHRSDIYFSQGMNYTRYDPLYPANANEPPPPNVAQLYPAHQQQFYGSQYFAQHGVRAPSPAPPPMIPLPPKPQALQQETRQNGRQAPLHPAMYRSFTSPPPVPPKPSLLFEPDPGSNAIPTSAYLGNSRPGTTATSTAVTSSPPPVPPLPSGATAATEPPAAVSQTEGQEGQGQQAEDDGDELAVALALSKDESAREEERMQELARQEEEEFERALAASMLTANSGYDFYESQPGAGPSNWVPSVTQSPPPVPFNDVQPEAGPSTSSSTASDAISMDTGISLAQPSQSTDEQSLNDENTSRVPEETNSGVGAPRAASPLSTKRRSLDTTSLRSGASSTNHEEALPIYSSEAVDHTPTASSFPPTVNQPEPEATKVETSTDDRDGDSDGDELPYLRGAREHLTVTIPNSNPPRALSPVSASFIDLSYDDSYIDEDEALARRLTEEEERAHRLEEEERDAAAARQESHQNGWPSTEDRLSRNSSATTSSTHPHPDTPSDLPTYNDVISVRSAASRRSTFLPEVRVDSPLTPAHNEKAELARNISFGSVASDPTASSSSTVPFPSATTNGPSIAVLPHDGSQRVIGRVSSMSALLPSRPQPEDDLPLTPVDDLATPINRLALNSRPGHLTATSINNNASSPNDLSPGPSSVGVLNANHFIDSELLHGVSINFTPPVISPKLIPMGAPMPTLISLPYGRCPPLHFQAPSWRHLLKLMARLSGTKMEPSIEAMAVTKNEVLKLRTVIQFIKSHHASQEWRTILWFTIDHPVPNNIPNANKYASNNVNNLPFSYTLSSVPAMLRDASDTVLSKTYTIPATASVPYPSLPITFPNLALYLQAALDDSRRQSESNPLRKLAKMVQTCYPNDLVPQDPDEPGNSKGVSGLFKKVMGRGGKKGKRGGGNEDTYDLVTPFVPDEWG